MHIYRNPNISKVKYQVNNMVSVSEGEGLQRYGDSRRNLPLMPYRGHKCAYYVPDSDTVLNVPFVVNDSGYTHISVLNGSGGEVFYGPLSDIVKDDGLAYVEIQGSQPVRSGSSSSTTHYYEAFLVEEDGSGNVVRNSVSTTFWVIYKPVTGYSQLNDGSLIVFIYSDYLVPTYFRVPNNVGDPIYYKVTKYSRRSYYGDACTIVLVPAESGVIYNYIGIEIGCYAPESDFAFSFVFDGSDQ